MFTRERIILLVIILLAVIVSALLLWNYRGMIFYDFRTMLYPKEKMIEKYFHVSLNQECDIMQYSLVVDEEEKELISKEKIGPKANPHIFTAEILVNQSSVDGILQYYSNSIREQDNMTSIFERPNRKYWKFDGTLDFYIWYPIIVNYWSVGSRVRGQADTYIFVSKPQDEKCHIFLYKTSVGLNEE